MIKGLPPYPSVISFKTKPAALTTRLLKNQRRTECPQPGSAQNERAPFRMNALSLSSLGVLISLAVQTSSATSPIMTE